MSDEIIEAGRNDCIKAYCVKSSFATRSKWLSQHPQVMQLPASITDTKIPKHIRFCLYMAHQGFAKILDSNFIEGLPVKNNNSKTVSAAGAGEQDATSTSTGSAIIPPEKRTVSACIGTFLRECASKMKGASMSILTRNHHKLFAVLCGISKNPFDSEQITSDNNNNNIDDAENKENNKKNEDASGGDNVNDNDGDNQASSSPELTIQQEFELAYKKFKAPNALVFDTFYDDHNPMKTREEKRIEMEKRLEQEALAELKLMEEKARQQQEKQEKLRQQKEEDEKRRKAEKEQRLLMKQQRREERMKLAHQQQQQQAPHKEAPNRRKRQEDDDDNDDEGYQQNQQLLSDGGNQLLQHEQIQLGVYYDEDDDENTEDENSNLVFEELAKRQQQQNGNDNNNNSLNIVDNANHFQISRGQNSTINNPFSYTGNNNNQQQNTAAPAEGVFSVQKLRKKILAIINSQQLVTIRDLPQLLNKTDTSEIGSGWTIADIEDCVNDLQKIGSVFVEEGTIFV